MFVCIIFFPTCFCCSILPITFFPCLSTSSAFSTQPQTPTHLEDITEIIRKDTEKEQTKFETPASAGTVPRNQVGHKVGKCIGRMLSKDKT